jgi:hypothetical protein
VGWFMIVFAVAATLLLNYTAMGRRIFAVGNSALVARLSGVRTGIPILFAYMLSGLCSAIVGILLAGVLWHGRPLPALVNRRCRAGRYAHHRRTWALSRHSRRRDPVHRAGHHALRYGAARSRAQHNLRRRRAGRDNRPQGAAIRLASNRTIQATPMRVSGHVCLAITMTNN